MDTNGFAGVIRRRESPVQIFSELEDYSEGAGTRFVAKLDFTLNHLRANPEMAPMFEEPVRRLVIGSSGYGLFYSVEARRIICARADPFERRPREYSRANPADP
jgi:hypothetical protein